MSKKLLRLGGALMVSLAFGVGGALVGLGWGFLFPAQYTSTAHVVVQTGRFAGDQKAALAYINRMIEGAQDPQALSIVIASKDLYHYDRHFAPLTPLVAQFKRALHIQAHTGMWNTAAIELSLTYPDRLKVQAALDNVIWFLSEAEMQQNRLATRTGILPLVSLESHRAGVPERTASLDPEVLVLIGFIGGLFFCATASQLVPPPKMQPQS
jgi:hypothetical protein